jgi:murein DD-endopeptidase MepM/ murein hydrolase activator NlpD
VKNARSASSLALILSLCFASGFPAHAADTAQSIQLSEKLEIVRTQRLNIEKALVDAEKTKKSTEAQLKRLKSLQKLQHQEKELTEKRLAELEKYLVELTTRKDEVQKKIEAIQGRLRIKFSKLVHPLLYEQDRFLRGDEGEGERAVRDRVISSVTLLELKELESLHADLLDADEISARIEEEKQQISSLMQDISEQESLIAFHKKLREDITKDKHEEHLRQLDEYRKLKTSEVEPQVAFRAKSLPWPLKGKLVGTYGQHKDEKTGLNIFKKGIDILTMVDDAPVTAVMDGKIQFAGDIPGKGKVVIVEHPGSLFTIYAGLRDLTKQTGTDVKASEKLGTLETQTPLYFEIRARNVAIDPVKWLQ